jgi:hypothetical protein
LNNTVIRLFNRTVDIGWASWSRSIHDSRWREVVQQTPTKLIAPKYAEGDVRFCPAFNAYWKNTYEIRMPFDISIAKIDGKIRLGPTPNLQTNKHGGLDMASLVTIQDSKEGMVDRVTIQVMLNNTFVSDTPYVMIETMPPILHGCREEIRYMNGRFDCHAWQRPVQLGFQIPKETIDVMNEDDSIIFSKDEVVMYVRFITPNDAPVKMHIMSPDDVEVLSTYADRNITTPFKIKNFNLKEIVDRVRYRRPKQFIRDKTYGKEK